MVLYVGSVIYYLTVEDQLEPIILKNYIWCSIQMIVLIPIVFFINERDGRNQFLLHNKVVKLLSE